MPRSSFRLFHCIVFAFIIPLCLCEVALGLKLKFLSLSFGSFPCYVNFNSVSVSHLDSDLSMVGSHAWFLCLLPYEMVVTIFSYFSGRPWSLSFSSCGNIIHRLNRCDAIIVIYVWKLHPFAQFPSRKLKSHCVPFLSLPFWFVEPFCIGGLSYTVLQGGSRNVYQYSFFVICILLTPFLYLFSLWAVWGKMFPTWGLFKGFGVQFRQEVMSCHRFC